MDPDSWDSTPSGPEDSLSPTSAVNSSSLTPSPAAATATLGSSSDTASSLGNLADRLQSAALSTPDSPGSSPDTNVAAPSVPAQDIAAHLAASPDASGVPNPQPQAQRQQNLSDLAAAMSPWVDSLQEYDRDSWRIAFELVQAEMDYQREAELQQEHDELEAEEAAQDRTDSNEAADDHSSDDLNASDNQQLYLSPVAARANVTQLPQQERILAPETSSRNSTAAGGQPLPVFVTGGMFMPASAQQPQQQLPGPHQQQTAQIRGHQLAGQQRTDSLQSEQARQTFQDRQLASVKADTAEKNLAKAFLAEVRW